MMKSLQILLLGILTLSLAPTALSQPAAQNPPQMRSRYLTTLTNFEVENFLQRNDLIYVPVGNVQAHGVLPVDCEYVAAEALALKMAEETDGLVAPYLQFTYPGDGAIGRGTVEVSPTEGLAYLKTIARSLLRQGFKRQIWVTSNGAAAAETVSPLILEFFYESKNPVLYIMGDVLMKKVKADPAKVMFGAYSILNRLEDIPVGLAPSIPNLPPNEGLKKLQALSTTTISVGGVNGNVGFFQTEDKDAITGKAITSEQRAAYAKEGVAMIEAMLRAADMKKAAQSLLDHQRFTREYVIPKYEGLLP